MKHSIMRHRTFNKNKLITYTIWGAALALVLFIIWAQNNLILTKSYVFSAADLRKSLVGYKIVHVTDLCNSGKDISGKVKKLEPDIIVISGGFEDDNGNSKNSVKTVNKLAKIAPTYYVYSKNDSTDCMEGTDAINISDSVVELEPVDKEVEQFIIDNYGNDILKDAAKGTEIAVKYVEYVKEELANCKTDNVKIGLIGLGRYGDAENEVKDKEALDKAYELLLETDAEYTIGVIGNAKILPEVSKSRLNAAFTGGTYGTVTLSKKYTKGLFGFKSLQAFFCGGIGTRGNVKRVFNPPEIICVTLSDGTITYHNPLENFIGMFWKDVGTIYDNDGGFSLRTYEVSEHEK